MNNNYPKMDGKSNIYNGHTDDTYLSNLLFRQNNSVTLLNDRNEIRENSIIPKKIKDIEENGFTNVETLNATETKS